MSNEQNEPIHAFTLRGYKPDELTPDLFRVPYQQSYNIPADSYHDGLVYVPNTNPAIDNWEPRPDQLYFTTKDKFIIVPLTKLCKIASDTDAIDYFDVSMKKGFNMPKTRNHICHYLNYFVTFYDYYDMELISIYRQIKTVLDYNESYTIDACIADIERLIVYNSSIQWKIECMVHDCNIIRLEPKAGKSIKSLQYYTSHGEILMRMSITMDMVIPLISHCMRLNPKEDLKDKLFSLFDDIMTMSYVDMYSKLHESSMSFSRKNVKTNQKIWKMQAIRGNTTETHSDDCDESIVTNIIPKYVFNHNPINLNYVASRTNTRCKITNNEYEYDYNPLSSSKRDEDCNSEFDKFESYMIRQSMSMNMQNRYNYRMSMNNIYRQFDISDLEVSFYNVALTENNSPLKDSFQTMMVFYIAYKYFGDTISVNNINEVDYISLMIMGKRILLSNGYILMPYVLSSRIIKPPTRKKLTKSEQLEVESYPAWQVIRSNYNNEKNEAEAMSVIAQTISAEYSIIDYDIKEIHGRILNTQALKSTLMKEVTDFIAYYI